MPLRLKRALFLAVVGTAACLRGISSARNGNNWVIGAPVLTVVLAVGWKRTYRKGGVMR
jgi:hypothetical protein